MHKLWREAVSLLLGVLLLCLPIWGQTADLIGVVKATHWWAEINGMLIPGDTNVFSGDRLCTGPESTLSLVFGPQERMQLALESCVRLIKDRGITVIGLEQGWVAIRSRGSTHITLENYGVTIQPPDRVNIVVAEVALLDAREALVCVLKGQMEVLRTDQSVLLQEGELGVIPRQGAAVASTGRCSPAMAKAAIPIPIIAGSAAAVVLPLALTRGQPAVSPSVP